MSALYKLDVSLTLSALLQHDAPPLCALLCGAVSATEPHSCNALCQRAATVVGSRSQRSPQGDLLPLSLEAAGGLRNEGRLSMTFFCCGTLLSIACSALAEALEARARVAPCRGSPALALMGGSLLQHGRDERPVPSAAPAEAQKSRGSGGSSAGVRWQPTAVHASLVALQLGLTCAALTTPFFKRRLSGSLAHLAQAFGLLTLEDEFTLPGLIAFMPLSGVACAPRQPLP